MLYSDWSPQQSHQQRTYGFLGGKSRGLRPSRTRFISRQLSCCIASYMPGCWLLHAVPGLEARGLCPLAPPLYRCLDPSDGVFVRFDLAALCGCHTLNVCCCCCCYGWLVYCECQGWRQLLEVLSCTCVVSGSSGLVSIGMLHECKVKRWTGIRLWRRGMVGGLHATASG